MYQLNSMVFDNINELSNQFFGHHLMIYLVLIVASIGISYIIIKSTGSAIKDIIGLCTSDNAAAKYTYILFITNSVVLTVTGIIVIYSLFSIFQLVLFKDLLTTEYISSLVK